MEQATAIEPGEEKEKAGKSASAFRTISEVSKELEVPQHVLRFWETRFSQIKPLKRGGGRRYYRPEDLALLLRIRDLLYTEGYTIRGVQRLLRQYGVRAVLAGAIEDSGAASAVVGAEIPEVRSVDEPEVRAVGEERGLGAGLDPALRRELEGVLSDLVRLRSMLGRGSED